MTPNNNLSILPFYLDISKQNHRKDYAFGDIFPLLTPDRKILPFQILRTHRGNGLYKAWIMNLDGSIHQEITTQILETGLTFSMFPSDGYDIIKYQGVLPMAVNTPEGQYYLQLTDGVEQWFSEVYTVVRFMDPYLKIEYRDFNNLQFDEGQVDFAEGFKFHLYLPTQVGRPDYEFEEQVDKRDGFQFIEKQISEKTYKFNFVAPEFLLDAMRIIRMMDEVTIYSKGDSYKVNQFLMTPKWKDGGYLASVDVEFQCNTVIKKIGRATLPLNGADFNNDFNNDFKIE